MIQVHEYHVIQNATSFVGHTLCNQYKDSNVNYIDQTWESSRKDYNKIKMMWHQ